MQDSCTQLSANNEGDVPKYHGSITDKRTVRWRIWSDIAVHLETQAGEGITRAQRERIARAAELQVLAQDVRIRALANPNCADLLNALVRLENLANRALKSIGIAAKPSKSRLQQYLASKRDGHELPDRLLRRGPRH